MKLNHECVRDLLLTIESSSFNETLYLEDIRRESRMDSYSVETIIYTAQKLNEAEFINFEPLYGDAEIQDIAIESIHWKGHQFLDTIRDPSIWESVKKKTSKLASVSLPMLSSLATSFMEGKLGLS